MDKSNQILKKNFVNVFCSMSKVCKDTLTGVNVNYHQGRKDAFEEILAWFNGSEKVSANSLSLFLQEKLNKLKGEDEEEMKPIFDMNEMRYDLFSVNVNASYGGTGNFMGNQFNAMPHSGNISANAGNVQCFGNAPSISQHRKKNR